MPAGDAPSTENLKQDFKILPVQGKDPRGDEEIGMHFFVRFGGKGFSPFPKFLRTFLRTNVWPRLLNDPVNDCVFMDRIFLWTTIMAPMWLYLLLIADYQNNKIFFGIMYLAYFAMWFDQFASYILALHCIVHRGIFSAAVARYIKPYFVWFLGPMLGETPETYNAHHVHMHHPMNNGYNDLSTTLTYKRDGGWDFVRYLVRFLLVHFELWGHLTKRNNMKLAKRFVTGEIVWMTCGALVYSYRPFAAALLYVLPIVVVRLGMTAGNWGQHAFINPKSPFTNTCQSCTILNSMYNTIAFNDGYHIQHHEYPNAAYHELPFLFNKMLPAMAEDDSVVFDARGGVGTDVFDFVGLWFLLMAGKYDVLADHFVDVPALVKGSKPRPKEEIMKMLQERASRVYDPVTTPEPKKA